MKKLRVGVVGCGRISVMHFLPIKALRQSELVACCDIKKERADEASEKYGCNAYYDYREMLAKEQLDVIHICLPHYLHVPVSMYAMEHGVNVLSEKPMALNSADCEEMLRTARECGRKLMIGQCLRFEPSYLYLKQCIDSGCFGRLKNLFMDRLSVHPMWGFEQWYTKTEKSGGCILDLHIHDIDMARFLLGEPESVSTVSYDDITRWQVVNTRLFYKNVTVIATATWDEAPTTKVSAGFRARFEQASVVLNNEGLTVYPNSGKPYHPDIPRANRMAEEIRKLASMVRDRSQTNEANPPESAWQTVRLIERLRESADQGGKRIDIQA